jgi:3-dehydroquinate synthase II/3-amino-4-hydroxybenzoic acid synthase
MMEQNTSGLFADKTREIWFDGRPVPFERGDIWGLVNISPVEKVLVTVEQRRMGLFPAKTVLVTEICRPEDLDGMEAGGIVLSERLDLLEAAKRRGCGTCAMFAVDSGERLETVCRIAAEYDYVVVDFHLPTNIPLELLIARLPGRKTVLLRRVDTAAGMETAFGVLEEGSDGILFAGTDPAEIQQLTRHMLTARIGRLTLTPLVVEEVRGVGMGLRACIDTTGLMDQREGMLVGSTSSGGIFVCSETHFLPYMNLRPFRVNAGAVHSYVWMPGDAAEYITDLKAGSKVLCVDAAGKTRVLTVGRVKIEARPLLLVRGKAADRTLNVIVQDDWHIRLMGADGKPENATLIKPGDELLSYVCQPGRHVGIKVGETIIEL